MVEKLKQGRKSAPHLHKMRSLNIYPVEHAETEIEFDEPFEESLPSHLQRERIVKLERDLAAAQKELTQMTQIQAENKILRAENEDLTRKNSALADRATDLEVQLGDSRRETQEWRDKAQYSHQRDAGLCARVKVVHRKR